MARFAAGRARALGLPTRGTTAPNRLRRVDRWIVSDAGPLLRAAADPLVVDLGYGSSPVTTVELAARLRAVRADVRVVGLENDPARVVPAPGVETRLGGFELAGLRPVLVRAMNVLRQYPEPAVPGAWRRVLNGLAPGGRLVEGTCDETGRIGAWLTLDAGGPRWLTLSCSPAAIDRPSDLAGRLPKALIHRNVPGEPVHALLAELDRCWELAPRPFGPRVRFARAVSLLAERGWPVRGSAGSAAVRRRWRAGELAVRWPP